MCTDHPVRQWPSVDLTCDHQAASSSGQLGLSGQSVLGPALVGLEPVLRRHVPDLELSAGQDHVLPVWKYQEWETCHDPLSPHGLVSPVKTDASVENQQCPLSLKCLPQQLFGMKTSGSGLTEINAEDSDDKIYIFQIGSNLFVWTEISWYFYSAMWLLVFKYKQIPSTSMNKEGKSRLLSLVHSPQKVKA